MPKTEHRAYAAVHESGGIDYGTIRLTVPRAKEAAGFYFGGGWNAAERAGWSIRPVIIRINDEGEGQ